jgi:hypothetical protein
MGMSYMLGLGSLGIEREDLVLQRLSGRWRTKSKSKKHTRGRPNTFSGISAYDRGANVS